MESRKYTPAQILALRSPKQPCPLSDTVKKAKEFADIIKTSPPRSRRSEKPKPSEPIQKIPTGPAAQSGAAPQIVNSQSNRAVHVSTRNQTDGHHNEWRYRGRANSEMAITQPISAPTGPAAQKDEGFQRFYNAVVSPTHVRVTAGGRIVPNNRGAAAQASPTSKWSKDKAFADSDSVDHRLSPQPQAEPPAAPVFYGHPQFSGFPTMFPGVFPHPAAWGMLPPPVNMFGRPHVPPQSTSLGSKDQQASHGEQETRDGLQDPGLVLPSDQAAMSGPFLYNGQYVVPAGPMYHPFGLWGYPGFPPQPMPSVPTAPVQSEPVSFLRSSPAHRNSPNVNQGGLAKQPILEELATHTSRPAMTSIRESVITNRQLEQMRGTLKYIEDQLKYNKHQIDERYMQAEAHKVQTSIHQFKQKYEEQLAREEAALARQENKTSQPGTAYVSQTQTLSALANPSSTSNDNALAKGRSSTMREDRSNDRIKVKKEPGSSFDSHSASEPSDRNYLNHSKRGTVLHWTAALATPFEPRGPLGSRKDDQYIRDDHRIRQPQFKKKSSSDDSRGSRLRRSNGFRDLVHSSVDEASMELSSDDMFGSPYLVGQLPAGIDANKAKGSDYVYDRPLTNDEVRARHLYWGKAPPHVSRGLPRFDGKDFYMPLNSPNTVSLPKYTSPSGTPISYDKGMTPKTDGTFPRMHSGNIPGVLLSLNESDLNSERSPSGLFDATTSKKQLMSDESSSSVAAIIVEDASTDVSKSSPIVAEPIKYHVPLKIARLGISTSEDSEALRKPMRMSTRSDRSGKALSETWNGIFKKQKANTSVLPGAVSSANAQGFLPRYGGHAAASLTPAVAKATAYKMTANSHRPSKPAVPNGSAAVPSGDARKGENCPPLNAS